MADLRDCPFCGSSNIAIGYQGQPAHTFHMRCVDCGACGPSVSGATPLGGFPATLGIEWNLRSVAATAPQQPAQDKPAAIPEGWKLVPLEPTGDMFRAAAKIDHEMFAGGSSHGADDEQIWNAMVDAAPAPDTGGTG